MQELDGQCPLCARKGVTAYEAWAADTPRPCRLSLRRCPVCGLAWQYPQVRSTKESAAFFTDAYEKRDGGRYFDPGRRRDIAALQTALVSRVAGPGASVLDVGAGDGAFVRAVAERGFNAVGVDPAAPPPTDLPRGAMLLRGTTAHLSPALRFNVVTAFDVIEHVTDPAALLDDCAARLADGGVLVIETGNFESAERVAEGDTWWCYQADHRWYFSPASLARLLRQAGWQSVGLWQQTLRPGASGGAAYPGPSLMQSVRDLVHKPMDVLAIARRYRDLRATARRWPRWSGISIFCVCAARLPGARWPDGFIDI